MHFLSIPPFCFLRHLKNRRKCGNPKAQPGSTLVNSFTQKQIQQHSKLSRLRFSSLLDSLQQIAATHSWAAELVRNAGPKIRKKFRISFLSTLQKALCEWLLCYHCEKLHPFILTPNPYLYAPWLFRDERQHNDVDGYLELLPRFGFRFQYAQMIMTIAHWRIPF